MSFVATCALACAIGGQQPGATSVKPSAGASSVPINASRNPVHHTSGAKDGELKFPELDVTLHPVFHIIEEPGAIRYLTECEVPTEEYNAARAADLAVRHPHCSPGVLEHLEARTVSGHLDSGRVQLRSRKGFRLRQGRFALRASSRS